MINLRNITDYSLEEIWQYAYDCIVEQGEASVSSTGVCLYRGPEDKKCAVGHMIADEDFNEEFNSDSISSIINYFDLNEFDKEVKRKVNFLTALQDIHDNCWYLKGEEFISEYKKNMKELKQEYAISE